MKRCIKKVYCPSCHRLVRCREQKVDNHVQILCTKCGHSLRVWNGMTWGMSTETA